MNAIISLCHFCEGHGPSILFCTQAFHSAVYKTVLEDSKDLNNGAGVTDDQVKSESGQFYLDTLTASEGADSSQLKVDSKDAEKTEALAMDASEQIQHQQKGHHESCEVGKHKENSASAKP